MHRTRRAFASMLALVVPLWQVCAAATVDGPYVLRTSAGGLEAFTVDDSAGEVRKQVRAVAADESIEIAAVGSLPAFRVTLRKPATAAKDTVSVAPATPLFVVADTHGQYEILAGMLRAHRVVNARLGWSFGRGHLVVLGDVFDRGPNQLEILWLLYELEAQARKAGGAVHLLLGNHETMILRGDLRYLHEKYRKTAAVSGLRSYSQLFDAGSVLGQWLRTRAAVLKLGDSLYLHGGLSARLVDRDLSLAQINDGVRAGLADLPPFGPAEREVVEFLLGQDGPLWYRGYFPERGAAPAATDPDVVASLRRFGVSRVVVGHTIVPTISSLYGGKVIAVQVYPEHEAGGRDHFECLVIRGGKLLRALPDGSTQPL